MTTMTDSRAMEVLAAMFQHCANNRQMVEADALNHAIARLREPAGVDYNYRAIAHLIGSIFFSGDFKAETANERTLESLLKEVGTRYTSLAEVEAGYEALSTPQPPAEALFMADSVHNQAPPGTREGHMVVLETDAVGKPTIWCDPEIVDLVRALNEGGLRTIASCSGHGEKPFGIVTLRDGRELLVLPDYETTRKAERILSEALIPAEAQVQGGGDSTFAEWLASEMPAGTVIGDPAWWADRIARQYAKRSAPPSAPVGVEAYLVERLSGEGYGKPRRIVDARIYDPTKPEFWADDAQSRHRVTPLVPPLAQQPAAVDVAALREVSRQLRTRYAGAGGRANAWTIADHANDVAYRLVAWADSIDTALAAQQPAACTACNDRREVGGATPEGFETHPCPECAQQPAAEGEKYAELIYAVASKYPNESRHETALRYIRQAESADHGPAQVATQHQEPTTNDRRD